MGYLWRTHFACRVDNRVDARPASAGVRVKHEFLGHSRPLRSGAFSGAGGAMLV
jgi:hypothetical protein